MVEIIREAGELTPKEVMDNTILQAMSELRIDENLFDEAKDWKEVRYKVGEIMQGKVKGRPLPYKKNSLKTPNLNSLKMLRTGILGGLYPKKVETDADKFKHLSELLEKKQIETDVFNDLVSVLSKEYNKPIKLDKKEIDLGFVSDVLGFI